MFTQKLTAWREKQRRQTASFQGKYRVEKSGEILHTSGTIRSHPLPTPRANHPRLPRIFIGISTLIEHLKRRGRQQATPSGAPWGGRWGTPGRGVGRKVGNAGEEGGENREPPKDLRRVAPNHHSDRFRSFRNAHQSHQPHTGQLHPQLACTFVRLWGYGWEDVRDGCAAFLVFRAGSARTLKQ